MHPWAGRLGCRHRGLRRGVLGVVRRFWKRIVEHQNVVWHDFGQKQFFLRRGRLRRGRLRRGGSGGGLRLRRDGRRGAAQGEKLQFEFSDAARERIDALREQPHPNPQWYYHKPNQDAPPRAIANDRVSRRLAQHFASPTRDASPAKRVCAHRRDVLKPTTCNLRSRRRNSHPLQSWGAMYAFRYAASSA